MCSDRSRAGSQDWNVASYPLVESGSACNWDTCISSKKWMATPLLLPALRWYTISHRCLLLKVFKSWRQNCLGFSWPGWKYSSSGSHWRPSWSWPGQRLTPWLHNSMSWGVLTKSWCPDPFLEFWFNILGGCWHGSYKLLRGSNLHHYLRMTPCNLITC